MKNRLAELIIKANNSHVPLPDKDAIVHQLYGRVARLEESLTQTGRVDEEILISGEIRRIREVIKTVSTERHTTVSGYHHFENKLNNLKKSIERLLTKHAMIPESMYKNYNLALYHYNEYCNVVDSLI